MLSHAWINTLTDSEVNLNFISQIKFKELDLSESLKIGSTNIHALNRGALHTYEWHTLGVILTDQDVAEQERQLQFLVTDLLGFNVILSLLWLQEDDPEFQWSTETWWWWAKPLSCVTVVGAAYFSEEIVSENLHIDVMLLDCAEYSTISSHLTVTTVKSLISEKY